MESSGSSKAKCMTGNNGEAELKLCDADSKRAGWITFPFIIGTVALLTLAGTGWMANLIVYLIREFNVNRIDAAQIHNVIGGCFSLLPILGAIIADSVLGCFLVASISSVVASMGMVLLSLTATLNSLRPKPCGNKSSSCKAPSNLQFAVLYMGIVLTALGVSGVRFTIATLGANQFESQKDQSTFFNWFFFAQYASCVLSSTLIVYIEDSVSWALGFWLCAAVNLIGLAVFIAGNQYYRHETPPGSPLLSLARVLVASFRKRKLQLTLNSDEFYYGQHGQNKEVDVLPKKNFRFLNRAAVKTDGDTKSDNSLAKPWRLCTVQQVEDLKFCDQNVTTVVQRHLLEHPNRCPKQHDSPPSPNHGPPLRTSFHDPSRFNPRHDHDLRLGLSRFDGSLALPIPTVEKTDQFVSNSIPQDWLRTAHLHHLQNVNNPTVPMSALWLFPQLILIGIGEAFHLPGQVSLYFQEFPANLSNSATAMVAATIGISYYLSTVLVDLVRRSTGWLPENLNDGRLDRMYWLLAGVGMANFGYYLVCAKLYKGKDGNSSSSHMMTDDVGENKMRS
ncbi:hypothetical protein NL676_004227 [Syzygium grande]|nr:hypothetical protein NL676_004227 [Syzygium grande]